MGFFEIFLIGVGLSMDAAAISMSNAMVHGKQRSRLLEMAFMFGFFQGLMPILGFGLCSVFSDVITRMGKILVIAIIKAAEIISTSCALNPTPTANASMLVAAA